MSTQPDLHNWGELSMASTELGSSVASLYALRPSWDERSSMQCRAKALMRQHAGRRAPVGRLSWLHKPSTL